MSRHRFLRTCRSELVLLGLLRRREPPPTVLPLFNFLVAGCSWPMTGSR